MAEAEHFSATADSNFRHDGIVHRTLLCAIIAGIEGAAAAILLLCVALGYHLLVLHHSFSDFATLFYVAYSLLTGATYAVFSAFACNRLLERDLTRQNDIRHVLYAWTAAIALTLLTAFLLGKVGDFSRVSLTSAYLAGIPALFGLHSLLRRLLETRIKAGTLHFQTIAIIGSRAHVSNFLLGGEIWRQGHRLTETLYFEDVRRPDGKLRSEAVSSFAARNLRRGTDHIVFVGDIEGLDEIDGVITELRRYALNLLYAPTTRNRTLRFLDVVAIGPNNVLRFVRPPIGRASQLLKRTFDLVLAALALAVLSPLLAVVALAISLESPGPVIYKQARRGFNGDTFMILKFRSMRVTESGYEMKQARKDDARITRVGRFIRSTSIDELPQLVNVLIGQMSLVGPRPHAISHDEELSRQLAAYAARQRIKPGITGWAQVNGFRGETSNHDQIKGRVEHDIYYIDNWSLLLDIWTLILTVFSPAARRNAR